MAVILRKRSGRGAALLSASLALLFSAAGAPAQGVDADRLASALAKRLGYDAPWIAEPQRTEKLRAFLAGKREAALPPQGFLSGAPTIRLTSDPKANTESKAAIKSVAAAGEVEYAFDLIRPGATSLRARVRGGTQLWQIDEGGAVPVGAAGDWAAVETEPVWLEAGPHRLRIALPPNGELSSLIVSAPCVPAILPTDLGPSERRLNYADKTTAMVRALGREDLLPEADEKPIVLDGDGYGSVPNESEIWVRPDPDGGNYIEAVAEHSSVRFEVQIRQDGVYTIDALIAGNGAPSSWDVNGCRVASLGRSTPSEAFRRESVASLEFRKGSHQISTVLRRGVRLRSLVLSRRNTDPRLYAEAASQLGLVEGAPNEPVSEAGLRSNLSAPPLEERHHDYDEMDDDHGGFPGPPTTVALLPVPDAPPEELPSDHIEAPYDTPASPYLPLAPVPNP